MGRKLDLDIAGLMKRSVETGIRSLGEARAHAAAIRINGLTATNRQADTEQH